MTFWNDIQTIKWIFWWKCCLLPIYNAIHFITAYRSIILSIQNINCSRNRFNSKQYQYFSHYIYKGIHIVFGYFHVANMRIKFFADVAAMSRLLHFISRYTQNGSQQQHTAWSRFYFFW